MKNEGHSEDWVKDAFFKPEKGTVGFGNVTFEGKPIDPGVSNKTGVFYYKHIYRTNFEGTIKQHRCMQWGAFCWKQLIEHPLSIFDYLRAKR